jgi:transketolase N-terminal domain/subunit
MTKSYDSIIGSVLNSLSDLVVFVEENEPSKAGMVRAIQQEIQILDYYMAYGEES